MAAEQKQQKPACVIAPSLLSCDFANMGRDAQAMLDAGADWLHVDVMDGHFVPNLSFGVPTVRSLRKATDAFLDVHLMVSDPGFWVPIFGEIGVEQFTFHLEAAEKPAALVQAIHDAGMKAGIAIKPGTPAEDLLEVGAAADLLLVMTVEPGFGGQKFMEDMMSKVQLLRQHFPDKHIQVDGGVGMATIDQCAKAGATAIVSGSGIFKAEDPKVAISTMRACVDGGSSNNLSN